MSPAAAALPGPALRVTVPASSANLGPGFDSVGLALGITDSYVVQPTSVAGVVVAVRGEGAGQLPTDDRHLVYRAFARALERIGRPELCSPGLRLTCDNRVPQGRGLGSSATAVVAGVAAAYGLLAAAEGDVLDLAAVNDLASEIEGHPDNASASVYGGLTLSFVEDGGRVRTVRPRVHPDVLPLVLLPQEQLATSTARAVLPTHVPHGDAALNSARVGLLVHAMTADPSLLVPATRDWLHQEQRRDSFPASMALVDRLRAAGHAAVISGAGPSVLVLTTADRAGRAAEDGAAPGWDALFPGMSEGGVAVDRVTLGEHDAGAIGHLA